jgi:RecB family endonuclease NucS
MKLDIYDRKYFKEYLENPLKQWHMNKTRVKKDNWDNEWNSYLRNIQNRQQGIMSVDLEGNMYTRYLEKFYREDGHLIEFTDYFSQKFLSSLVEELQFLSGEKLKTTGKVDFDKFDKLANKVIIELLS